MALEFGHVFAGLCIGPGKADQQTLIEQVAIRRIEKPPQRRVPSRWGIPTCYDASSLKRERSRDPNDRNRGGQLPAGERKNRIPIRH
ncbi:hypothetical protein M2336_000710 [Sphingobium sp. B1D7B]|nr:hypothetical protein [Sphingobium sp. B1D7B]